MKFYVYYTFTLLAHGTPSARLEEFSLESTAWTFAKRMRLEHAGDKHFSVKVIYGTLRAE